MNEETKSGSEALAAIQGIGGTSESVKAPWFQFEVECRDAEGNLVWSDIFRNTVTTVGKNDALDKYLAGSAYTAAWYIGLVDAAGFSAYAAGDTMASHAGWTEWTNYSEGTRQAATWGTAASSGSKTTSAASVFTMSGSGTLKGLFLVTNSTKGGTTGVLYSAGSFTEGDRPVANGYVVSCNLTCTFT